MQRLGGAQRLQAVAHHGRRVAAQAQEMAQALAGVRVFVGHQHVARA